MALSYKRWALSYERWHYNYFARIDCVLRFHKTNFVIAWFLRNWRMVIIVGVGFLIAAQSISTGNWIFAVPVSAIVIGVALNIVAMIANRGKMPVDTDGEPIDEMNHDAIHDKTRFRILADRIPFAGWLLSPGDILLWVGLLAVVVGRLLQSTGTL